MASPGSSLDPPAEASLGSLFASDRERRLWLWTLAVVVAIYSTLGLARTLADELRDRDASAAGFVLGLVMIAVGLVAVTLKTRPPHPALLAILVTTLIGGLDEFIQAFIPSRVFDPIDMAFNFGAGVMAVSASAGLSWAQRRRSGTGA